MTDAERQAIAERRSPMTEEFVSEVVGKWQLVYDADGKCVGLLCPENIAKAPYRLSKGYKVLVPRNADKA